MADVANPFSETAPNMLVSNAPSVKVENAPNVPLPSGWTSEFDAKFQRYFFINENVDPPVASWDDPRTDILEIAPEGADTVPTITRKPVESSEVKAAESNEVKAGSSEVKAESTGKKYAPPPPKKYGPPPIPASVDQSAEKALPAGWVAVLDAPSGRFFFVDQAGATTWNDPRTDETESAPADPTVPPAYETRAIAPVEVPHMVGVPIQAPPPPQGYYQGQPLQQAPPMQAYPQQVYPVQQNYVPAPQQYQQVPQQYQQAPVSSSSSMDSMMSGGMGAVGGLLMGGMMASMMSGGRRGYNPPRRGPGRPGRW
jgi:hypothetical protein